MTTSIGPGSWQIVLEATEARMTTSGRKGPRLLYAPPRVDGSFYLRPDATLAGFDLRLPLPSPELSWESADLDRDPHAWLRLGRREVRAPVSVMCAEIPGEHPYVKIVLETVFRSSALGLGHWPRWVTLRLFSEIRESQVRPFRH
ncbi:hypothetical protein [Nonomuraea solani]|uniref:hypothetical protein n=1 Tax=Nonomuraea solani TaxID=1144553 RepID=UPI0011B03E3C|nr:hypothetical protein [Nonomuraea solani]